MSIDDSFEMVLRFHRTFTLPAQEHPTLVDSDRARSRAKWIAEEAHEFEVADTLVEQADALLDIIYLALGGLVEMGVRPDGPFRIVHEANMSKLWNDGKPRIRNDGKLLKPPEWASPKLALQLELDRQCKS